ncbi:MAG: T9SS type A sorting domain-containing protein [Bacteroidetes bacterium]|nr:T9SS type A sorting domain-containing protein [Bacteroidota bacterium]
MKTITGFLLVSLLAIVFCSPVLSQDNAPKRNNSNDINTVSSQNPNIDGSGPLNVQSLTTVLPGNNSTSGNGRAPQGSRRFINTKYIITAAEMTASGFSGVVNSVGWRWNVPSPPAATGPTAQSTSSTGKIRVYLKDTVATATTIAGTFIDTNGAGYTKVIDGTITIPAGLAEINIDVPAGGPGTSSYTPTPGNAVILIFVYKTTDAVLPTPLGAPNVFCTNVGVGTLLLTYQSQTVGGSTGGASVFRPETRFGVPASPDDMAVTALTANPLSPVCIGTTEIFTATAKNLGTITQPAGVPVVLRIDGLNVETKFTTLSLVQDASENIIFTGLVLLPGTHIIQSFTQLPGDQIPANDTSTILYTVLNSVSTFPYVETFTNAAGWTVSGTANLWLLQPTVTNAAGKLNDTAARCNFYNISGGNAAILRSPPLDFTGLSNPVIHFYAAYRTFSSEDDSLQVLISTDCGATFTDVPVPYRKGNSSAPSLATLLPSTTSYIPANSGEWRHETIDLLAYANNPNVIIGFRGVSAFGNNLYIDNFIATNADVYCSNPVTAPGSYSCNPLVNVNFTTVGLRPLANLNQDISYSKTNFKSIENYTGSFKSFDFSSANPLLTGGNTDYDNPGGGEFSLTEHSNNYPPSTASVEIAVNATATSPNGAVYTPSIIYSKNWYTTTYTGNDKNGYALYDISIDLNGLSFSDPDSLYILKRADLTASWVCMPTTRAGNILTVSGLNTFSDFALAGNSLPCPNPAIPTITLSNGVLHHVVGPVHDSTVFTGFGCGSIVSVPFDPNHPGAYYFTFDILGSDPNLPLNGTDQIKLDVILPTLGCNDIVFDPVVPVPYQGSDILVHGRVTSTCDLTAVKEITIIVSDLCNNQAICHIGFDKPLPVELTSFVSVINGNSVNLNWTTATETNNSGFDIERTVTNGNWSKVGYVSGSGTTTSPVNYSFTDRNVASGKYNYRLKQTDLNGNFAYFNLSNEVNIGVPDKYDLSQNYPNPYNPSTKINYALPFDGKVSIKLFDISGKEVSTLVNEFKTAGYYTISFNASSLSSGVYFYRISAEGNGSSFIATKKMMVVK